MTSVNTRIMGLPTVHKGKVRVMTNTGYGQREYQSYSAEVKQSGSRLYVVTDGGQVFIRAKTSVKFFS
jgi:hypothetical protein